MELIIGFILAVALCVAAAVPERLGEDNERAWINHLADRSRARGGKRRRCRYVRAGIIQSK